MALTVQNNVKFHEIEQSKFHSVELHKIWNSCTSVVHDFQLVYGGKKYFVQKIAQNKFTWPNYCSGLTIARYSPMHWMN